MQQASLPIASPSFEETHTDRPWYSTPASQSLWMSAVSASLNMSTRPRYVLDAHCNLLVSNAIGSTLVADSELLEISESRLQPRGQRWRQAFRQGVTAVCHDREHEPVDIALKKPFERIPVLLRVSPLGLVPTTGSDADKGAAEGLAWVDVADVNAPHAIDSAMVRRLFGLTQRETELAASLANGLTLAETAASLRIKLETARSHLKNVFAKTEVNGQSQLVRVLMLTTR